MLTEQKLIEQILRVSTPDEARAVIKLAIEWLQTNGESLPVTQALESAYMISRSDNEELKNTQKTP